MKKGNINIIFSTPKIIQIKNIQKQCWELINFITKWNESPLLPTWRPFVNLLIWNATLLVINFVLVKLIENPWKCLSSNLLPCLQRVNCHWQNYSSSGRKFTGLTRLQHVTNFPCSHKWLLHFTVVQLDMYQLCSPPSWFPVSLYNTMIALIGRLLQYKERQ